MVHRPDAPSECPACHSARVARILYGLPHFTPELGKELDEGRVVLGGCCVFGDDPEWHCTACGHRWGRSAWAGPLR
jgi:hypothetical protein